MAVHTISTKNLKALCRKAYREGRLTAQQSTRSARKCVYKGENNTTCAIGAALSPTVLRKLCELNLNEGFSTRSIRHVVRFEDADFAQHLQAEHDQWAGKYHDNGAPVVTAPRSFLKLLGL